MKTTPVLSAILGGLLVLAVAQPVAAQNQDESADRVRELEEMVRRLAERVSDLEARLDQQVRAPVAQTMSAVPEVGEGVRSNVSGGEHLPAQEVHLVALVY